MTGWICPKCGRCLAPDIKECPHCPAELGLPGDINKWIPVYPNYPSPWWSITPYTPYWAPNITTTTLKVDITNT